MPPWSTLYAGELSNVTGTANISRIAPLVVKQDVVGPAASAASLFMADCVLRALMALSAVWMAVVSLALLSAAAIRKP